MIERGRPKNPQIENLSLKAQRIAEDLNVEIGEQTEADVRWIVYCRAVKFAKCEVVIKDGCPTNVVRTIQSVDLLKDIPLG